MIWKRSYLRSKSEFLSSESENQILKMSESSWKFLGNCNSKTSEIFLKFMKIHKKFLQSYILPNFKKTRNYTKILENSENSWKLRKFLKILENSSLKTLKN
jgi:hypothetical protein